MDSSTRCTEHSAESLMGYLYDECEPGERQRVEAHLATCQRCAEELESLKTVRGAMNVWTPPDPALGFRVVSEREASRPWWRMVFEPQWGLAAAMVVLGVGAAIVGVEVRYDTEGFAFRMGWADQESGGDADEAEARQAVRTDIADAPVNAESADPLAENPWSADLAALERQLRDEMLRRTADTGVARAAAVPAPAVGTRSDALLLEKLQGLITDSERRQQQELALWFTQLAQEYDMQRRADQQRVQEELGALEGVADYLVRVSQP